MQRLNYIFAILLGSLLSVSVIAENSAPSATTTSSGAVHKIDVTRGQTLSVKVLSSIAELSSARDQQGHLVSLNEKEYTVGSFTKTTISIVPRNGGLDDVITLDLSNNQPTP